MEEAIKYKNVIREYFLEYKNRDQVLRSIFYVILFGASFSPFVFGSVFIVKYKCRKLQTKNVGRCNYIL